MPNDPEGVEFALPGEGPELAPSRRRLQERAGRWTPWRLGLAMLAAAMVGFVVVPGFLEVLESIQQLPLPGDAPPLDDGLLADVRGEDTLYRLEARQAALVREMALLREWVSGVSGGEGTASGDRDLVRWLAELEAEHVMLGGEVARLEASQAALLGEVRRLEAVLPVLFDLRGEPGQLEGRD